MVSDLSKSRVLVTGGAGFIGSALIWGLNQKGCNNILVTDILEKNEKWRNLLGLRFTDYLEANTFAEKLHASPASFYDIRTIFHLGACSATTETDASYLIGNNFEWTKTLAHFALQQNIRFIYASSAATYGELASGICEDQALETLRPLNVYGFSKHLFDLYAQNAGFLSKITGLKYFNVFGPNEDHKGDMRSVVHKAYHQILESRTVSLFRSYRPEYQNGEQMRDFLYVKDAVAATIFLAEHVDGGGLFNIGAGEANTFISLVTAIFSALATQPDICFIEMPNSIRAKYQYFTRANISKLRGAGFCRSMTPLPEAVTDYVCNYLQPGLLLGNEDRRCRTATA